MDGDESRAQKEGQRTLAILLSTRVLEGIVDVDR